MAKRNRWTLITELAIPGVIPGMAATRKRGNEYAGL